MPIIKLATPRLTSGSNFCHTLQRRVSVVSVHVKLVTDFCRNLPD